VLRKRLPETFCNCSEGVFGAFFDKSFIYNVFAWKYFVNKKTHRWFNAYKIILRHFLYDSGA